MKSDQSRDLDHEHNIPAGRTILFASLALLSGLGLTTWLDNSDAPSLRGHLWAQVATVQARCDGRVERLLAETGEVVERNRPLVVLANDTLAGQLRDAAQVVTQRQAALQQAKSQVEVELSRRLEELESELLQTKLQAAGYLKEQYTHDFESAAWKNFLDRFDGLTSRDDPGDVFHSLIYPSSLSADETRVRAILKQESAENSSEVNAAQMELCETRLQQLQHTKDALPVNLRQSHGVELARTLLDSARAKLQRLEQQQALLTLHAPAYGIVGEFHKQVGEFVDAGQPIVQLFDRDQQCILLKVPTRWLAEFSSGRTVNLTFPGSVQRQGRVGPTPLQAKPLDARSGQAAADTPETVVLLRIVPRGKLWPNVPFGSTVEVSWDE